MKFGTLTSDNAAAMAEGDQQEASRALPAAAAPRHDWELEAPAHLGAPFQTRAQYRTSTQATIRGLILLLVFALAGFGGTIAGGNPVAIALMALVLMASVVVTALMIRRAVKAEVQAVPRDTLHRRRVRR